MFRTGPCRADVDGDGVVSILDLAQIGSTSRYGSSEGSASYDLKFDLDGDGSISILDLTIGASEFGRSCASTGANTGEGWERSLYAFLAEKERRSGSRRTVIGYSRMLQHFFGAVGKPPDRVTSPEVFAWGYGVGLSGKQPSSVTIGARLACHIANATLRTRSAVREHDFTFTRA